MSEQDTSEVHGSSIQSANGNHVQETPKSSNILRFSLLFISIIITLLIAPFFLTDNIFNICVFFATFTTLIFALTDLIIYLSKEPPHPATIHINSIENENKKANKSSLSIVVKKVIHHTQQYRVVVSRFMHSIFQTKWLIKTFAIALSFPISLTLTEHWKEISSKITAVLDFFIVDNKPLGISILITFIVALIIFHKKIIATFQKFISGLTSKYFIFTLASLAIIGALSALIIPSYTNWFREPGYTSTQQDSTKENTEKAQNTPTLTASPTGNKAAEVEQKTTSDLRLHFLYITGGIIAILGLIETNRKNSQDHIRQVHAARRDRYIEAVDKLSNKNASVRLGGVYALVGLVDEWLDDDNMDRETRIKEGQIIINNLCSYIRSPFPLADKIEEYEARKELEDLQKTESEKLSEEESSRLQVLLKRFKDSDEYKNPKDTTTGYAKFHEEQDVRRTIFVEMSKHSSTFTKNKNGDMVPSRGEWSEFEFDFSRATIFYPLNNLTIEKGNFSSSKFHAKAEFSRVTFTCNADFSGTIFTNDANFIDATFINNADFNKAIFLGEAKFIGATPFINAKDFSRVTFSGNADFNNAEFHSKANFMGAHFAQEANFNEVTFTGNVSFHDVIFTGEAKFGGATFTSNADFVEATFKSGVGIYKATFTNFEPTFIAMCWHARFSAAMNPRDYNFSVTTKSKPINIGTATLLGKSFRIPLSTILFDPDSNDISEPAKQIEDSGEERRKPFK